MPEIVVTYFELKGLGEPIRLLLSYAGQKFEDRRIKKDDWPAYKPKTPFLQLPVLTIDGKDYAQSVPILRYLGKKYGLSGADIEEDFEIDQNVELIYDLVNKAKAVYLEEDPEKKKKKQEENETTHYAFYLKKLSEILVKNNGHLAAGKLTWGDFVLAGVNEVLKRLLNMPELDKQYPELKNHHVSITSLPGVKEFVQNAPPDMY